MIGQDYFDLRARLGQTLQSLGEIVPLAGADQGHVVILENLLNSLKDPFVFVVTGEVNVGKSTLLNALFGADFTRTGIMPTTDKIYFFRHGPVVKQVPVNDTLVEVYVPTEMLKDFHIVDTPGTNSIESGHQEITERFVPMADLVIFVFSAMNPWAASAWQFLDKVHQQWMRHVIFVVQQSDLRAPEENEAILGYMKQLSRQRFGKEFPIFPVSAKKAFLARSSGLDREKLMDESGFHALEAHISRAIGGTGARVGKLNMAVSLAQDIRQSIEKVMIERQDTHLEKIKMLEMIVTGMATMQDRTFSKLDPAVEATAADFTHAADAVMNRTRERNTLGHGFRSLRGGDKAERPVETVFLEALSPEGSKRWEHAADIVEDDMGTVADSLGEAMREGLRVQVRDDLKLTKGFWKVWRERIESEIQQIVKQEMAAAGLAEEAAQARKRGRKSAVWLIFFAVLTLAGVGVLAWMQRPMEAVSTLGGGLLMIAAATFMFRRSLQRGAVVTEEKLRLAGANVVKAISDKLNQEVRTLYEGCAQLLQPTKDKLLDQERRRQALHAQLAEIQASLDALGAELHAMAAAGR